MKVLSVLVLLYLSCNLLNANHLKLQNYISTLKQSEFSYDYKQNKENSLKLRDSWIQPVNLTYVYSKSNPYNIVQSYKTTTISINQPIFESGGIYFGIKYADNTRKYNKYSIDIQRRKLITKAISLLIQIRQIELEQKQQNLKIQNSKINLIQIKQQYLTGQIDSGSLDNAIIQKNSATQALYNLQTSKQQLIAQFKSISDLNYKTAKLPRLTLVTKRQFLNNNLLLDKQKAQKEQSKYNKLVTEVKYLPSISLNAGYNWTRTNNQSYGNSGIAFSAATRYYNYGFRISMPLDYNSLRDIEVAKLSYLKSQDLLTDQKRASKAIFQQVIQNLQNYNKKIQLAKSSTELYLELLSQTKARYKVGKKTIYDVDTLKNSLKIQQLDIKIFNLDKQLALLNLYEQLKNAI